jgi:hypothetical protein
MVFSVIVSTHHPLAALAAWFATVATSYGLARTIFVAKARERREKLRAMVDALAHEVRESIAGR